MKEARLVNIRSLLLTGLILSSSTFQTYAYYHPDEGRWLSRDPIEERGGVNLYAFVRNEPLDLYDPDGQIAGVDDAVVITAAYAALASAGVYLLSPQGQEQCRMVVDGIAGGCGCACDALLSTSKDAYEKAKQHLATAYEHFSHLGGTSPKGEDPNDRWRNWNTWKNTIRKCLGNAKKRAEDCTTKAKEEILKKVQELEDALKKIDELPRGGGE